jgi:hypothetical protein
MCNELNESDQCLFERSDEYKKAVAPLYDLARRIGHSVILKSIPASLLRMFGYLS